MINNIIINKYHNINIGNKIIINQILIYLKNVEKKYYKKYV
jgi:hypothetical protein